MNKHFQKLPKSQISLTPEHSSKSTLAGPESDGSNPELRIECIFNARPVSQWPPMGGLQQPENKMIKYVQEEQVTNKFINKIKNHKIIINVQPTTNLPLLAHSSHQSPPPRSSGLPFPLI